MESNMATQKQVKTGSEQSSDLQEKLQKLRDLYADASEIGKTALENVIRGLKSGAPAKVAEAAGPLRRRVRDWENRAGECDTRSKVRRAGKGTGCTD